MESIMEGKKDNTLLPKGVLVIGDKDVLFQGVSKGFRFIQFGVGKISTGGMGILIPDINECDIDALSTYDLTGCIGLAMRGKDSQGKESAFFAHISKYSPDYNDERSVIVAAQDFVKNHSDLQIFWGTKYTSKNQYGDIDIQSEDAQRALSQKLGVWVRMATFIGSDKLTFFPRLSLLAVGDAPTAIEHCEKNWNDDAYSMISIRGVVKYEPNQTLIDELEAHHKKISDERNSTLRNPWQDEKRDFKIQVLDRIIKAYKVGDIDTLRTLGNAARENKDPMREKTGSKKAWEGSFSSTTADLAQRAWIDPTFRT